MTSIADWFRREEKPETPRLVLSGRGNIMNRMISDQDRILGWNRWDVSKNIPGMTILKTLRAFHNITLALSKSDSGQYTIHRSIDYKKFELVHEHDTPIHGMFLIDSGIVAFSADDGWYVTEDAGQTWTEFPVEGAPPAEAAVAIRIPSDEEYDLVTYSKYDIVVYSIDRKLYYCEYPDGGWQEAFDTNEIYTGEWYAALDGSQVGILAGVGNKLLASNNMGRPGSWHVKTTAAGIIRSITASDNSSAPAFLIAAQVQGTPESKLYWSVDLGDSLTPYMSRIDAVAQGASVFVTGTNEMDTIFAVSGYGIVKGNLRPRCGFIKYKRVP